MVEKTKKKILISGITGMLGSDLSETLKSDYLAYGIDLKTKEDLPEEYFFRYDITDIETLEKPFKDIMPWLVIHAAAFTDVDGCEKDPNKARSINTKGTKNLVDLCKKFKAKLVFISTDYVFDGEKGAAYTIEDSPNPLNVYGQTKLDAENYIQTQLKEFLIVRTSWLFGKHGKNFVQTILNKAKEVDKLEVVDDQRGSPTYTVSLAEAIKKLINMVFVEKADDRNFGIYHISNSETCTWYEFAKTILELSNINTEILPVDSSAYLRPAKRPALSVLDNSRYEQITKQRLCSWKDALKKYLDQT